MALKSPSYGLRTSFYPGGGSVPKRNPPQRADILIQNNNSMNASRLQAAHRRFFALPPAGKDRLRKVPRAGAHRKKIADAVSMQKTSVGNLQPPFVLKGLPFWSGENSVFRARNSAAPGKSRARQNSAESVSADKKDRTREPLLRPKNFSAKGLPYQNEKKRRPPTVGNNIYNGGRLRYNKILVCMDGGYR